MEGSEDGYRSISDSELAAAIKAAEYKSLKARVEAEIFERRLSPAAEIIRDQMRDRIDFLTVEMDAK